MVRARAGAREREREIERDNEHKAYITASQKHYFNFFETNVQPAVEHSKTYGIGATIQTLWHMYIVHSTHDVVYVEPKWDALHSPLSRPSCF